jgi:hypothetical protein
MLVPHVSFFLRTNMHIRPEHYFPCFMCVLWCTHLVHSTTWGCPQMDSLWHYINAFWLFFYPFQYNEARVCDTCLSTSVKSLYKVSVKRMQGSEKHTNLVHSVLCFSFLCFLCEHYLLVFLFCSPLCFPCLWCFGLAVLMRVMKFSFSSMHVIDMLICQFHVFFFSVFQILVLSSFYYGILFFLSKMFVEFMLFIFSLCYFFSGSHF